ncbi:ROK family protein [Lactobacillus sp. ESL0677]|uniref:ROK family protein n=1 Tax=Lactobacillus sp. ESL0677 TaxID=2983208 RepID=UPI0023F9FDDF|nr:ROK family protein [Lactobacillus sp. ESL0677]WEV36505.1 ROK family protein [Lactobacillus sp. ESL0677]
MKLAIFDIGGTTVKTGYFVNDCLIDQSSFTTPKSFADLIKKMHQLIDDQEITGIAISAPGAVDTKLGKINGISAVPYIHHRPIFKELVQEFQLPVAIENDANCAGICEVKIGAGKDYQNVAFIVIGTGIGGAVFIDKKLYKGSHLFGGEFGLIKTAAGPTLSLRATIVKAAAAYEKQTGASQVNGEKLFALSEQDDQLAQKLITQIYDDLANALYDIQVAFDFDALIIGGGVSAHPGFSAELAKRLQDQLTEQSVAEIMPVVKSCQYHNDANLYGAAYNFIVVNGRE